MRWIRARAIIEWCAVERLCQTRAPLPTFATSEFEQHQTREFLYIYIYICVIGRSPSHRHHHLVAAARSDGVCSSLLLALVPRALGRMHACMHASTRTELNLRHQTRFNRKPSDTAVILFVHKRAQRWSKRDKTPAAAADAAQLLANGNNSLCQPVWWALFVARTFATPVTDVIA